MTLSIITILILCTCCFASQIQVNNTRQNGSSLELLRNKTLNSKQKHFEEFIPTNEKHTSNEFVDADVYDTDLGSNETSLLPHDIFHSIYESVVFPNLPFEYHSLNTADNSSKITSDEIATIKTSTTSTVPNETISTISTKTTKDTSKDMISSTDKKVKRSSSIGTEKPIQCKPAVIAKMDIITTDTSVHVNFTTSKDIEKWIVKLDDKEKCKNKASQSCIITGLNPCTKMLLRLEITSCSTKHKEETIHTKLRVAPEITFLDAETLPNHKIRASWGLTFNNTCNANITYNVRWNEVENSEKSSFNITDDKFIFDADHENKQYEVCISSLIYEDFVFINESEEKCIVTNLTMTTTPPTTTPKCEKSEIEKIDAKSTSSSINFSFTTSQPFDLLFAGVDGVDAECDKNNLCIIRHLQECTEYNVTVEITSCQQYHRDKKTIPIITKLSEPPQPTNLKAESLSKSKINVSWDLKFDNICNANISYTLIWREIDGISQLDNQTTQENSLQFTSKTGHTKFNICITTNLYKNSELIRSSNPRCITSNYSSPFAADEPKIINHTVSADEISIQYQIPKTPNEEINLEYCLIKSNKCVRQDSKWEKFQPQSSNFPLLTVGNLDSCTEYCILIRANIFDFDNTTLWGKSSSVQFKTKTELLPAPNLSTTFKSDTKLSLIWDDTNSKCERNFTVLIRSISNCRSNEIIITTNETELLINGLSSYTTYEILISTKTDAGIGSTFKIQETTDYSKPLAPQVIPTCGSRKCTFDIEVPSQLTGPTTYVIRDDKKKLLFNSKSIINISTEMCLEKNTIQAHISNLIPFKKYIFHVEAAVENITEITQTILEITTKPAEPEEPQQLQVDCKSEATQAVVSWMKPETINGNLEKFIITYDGIREGKENHKDQTTVDARFPPHLATFQLKPDYNYTFKVKAKNYEVDNPGPESETNCYKEASLKPEVLNKKFEDSDVIVDEPNSAIILLKNELFSDTNGIIVNYSIIISQENLPPFLIVSRFWCDVEKADKILPYRTTPNNWNPFKNDDDESDMCCEKNHTFVQCRIGCNSNCSDVVGPCNGPLRTDTDYQIIVRAYTTAGFSQTKSLSFSTAALNSPNDERNGLGIQLGLSALVLIIVVCCALLLTFHRNEIYKLIYRIRRDKEVNSVFTTTCSEQIVIENQSSTRPVPVEAFNRHYNLMNKDSGLKFSQEFEEIKAISPSFPAVAAHLIDNKQKNRWINILPFDHSRVKLIPISDEMTTDYINACYIPGYNSQREYIATQGPLPGTKDDFWRMIWEQSCQMIVMVTQCVERGKRKCEIYWPEDREVHYYGDLAIQLRSESILNNFTIRIFDLFLGTKTLEVKQMHFTKWPDFGCPENTNLLINFVRDVREHSAHGFVGPYVIHCSAGVGRTGTYISVDRLMQHIQNHNYVDIYGLVLEMRQFRLNMVQTEDQYIYIHSCVRDLLTGKTAAENEPLYANVDVNSKVVSIRDSQL